jgi:hypothetical protein
MEKDNRDTAGLSGNRDKILTCLTEVGVVRGSDMLSTQPQTATKKGLIADIGKVVPGAVLKLDETRWKWDSFHRIYTVNLQETIAASAPNTFADPEAVSTAVRDYGKTADPTVGYDPAYNHYRVHQRFRVILRTLKKRC